MSAMNDPNSLDAVKEFLIRYGVRIEDLEDWRTDLDDELSSVRAKHSALAKVVSACMMLICCLSVFVLVLAVELWAR